MEREVWPTGHTNTTSLMPAWLAFDDLVIQANTLDLGDEGPKA
jgi:hypothetical protein